MSTTTLLETNKIKYLDLTHKLNDYNEIYSVNSYLQGATNLELTRLRNTNNMLKSRILKMKQQYMMYDHDVDEYMFRLNILYFTAAIVAVVLMIASLFMQGYVTPKLAMIISGGLIIIYLIIVLFTVKANAERRKYAYDQFYWKPVDKKK